MDQVQQKDALRVKDKELIAKLAEKLFDKQIQFTLIITSVIFYIVSQVLNHYGFKLPSDIINNLLLAITPAALITLLYQKYNDAVMDKKNDMIYENIEKKFSELTEPIKDELGKLLKEHLNKLDKMNTDILDNIQIEVSSSVKSAIKNDDILSNLSGILATIHEFNKKNFSTNDVLELLNQISRIDFNLNRLVKLFSSYNEVNEEIVSIKNNYLENVIKSLEKLKNEKNELYTGQKYYQWLLGNINICKKCKIYAVSKMDEDLWEENENENRFYECMVNACSNREVEVIRIFFTTKERLMNAKKRRFYYKYLSDIKQFHIVLEDVFFSHLKSEVLIQEINNEIGEGFILFEGKEDSCNAMIDRKLPQSNYDEENVGGYAYTSPIIMNFYKKCFEKIILTYPEHIKLIKFPNQFDEFLKTNNILN